MDRQQQIDRLYDRLDNLESCEDNPVYRKEIIEIRNKIVELNGIDECSK